jgi:hypothetical protein
MVRRPSDTQEQAMSEPGPLCPSSSPSAESARVFAVVGGTPEAPRASYLAKNTEVPAHLLQTPEGIAPTRIFRFAGKCIEGGCGQFANGACQLGKTVNRMLDAVADSIPACTIRAECRWFAENGPSICLKCPQVVTTVRSSEPELQAMLAQVSAATGKQEPLTSRDKSIHQG